MPTSILIVDDQPALSAALMARLRALGHDVFHAINGLAGVEAAAYHEPGLVILDIGMPDIDGFDAFERIRRLRSMARVPIVFLTGFRDEGTLHRARALGAAGILTKPYSLDDLVRVVEAALSQGCAAGAAPAGTGAWREVAEGC